MALSSDAAQGFRNGLADLQTVVFGPSDIRPAHAAGPSIGVDEIRASAKALALAVMKWCGTD